MAGIDGKALALALVLSMVGAPLQAEDDSPHREEAVKAAAAVDKEAARDAKATAADSFALKIVEHFDPITDHDENPPPARVEKDTPLRDSLGNPLYDIDSAGKKQPITVRFEAGGESPRLVVQLRPVLKDRKGNRIFYVRGTVGHFDVGGRPAPDDAKYSGFILAKDFVKPDLAKLETGSHQINSVAPPWGDWLTRGDPAKADRKPYYIGTYQVAPEPVVGVDIGKSGTAHHNLRLYGWAHGQLKDFAFGCINLEGIQNRGSGGGQVEVVLPRGTPVHATRIVMTHPHTVDGPKLHFRLCTVMLGPDAERVCVATWIAAQCLKKVPAPPGGAPRSAAMPGDN